MSTPTLIFDFDGTIVDSFDATLDAGNRFASEYHYKTITREEAEMLRCKSYREVAKYMGVAWHRIPRVAVRIRQEMESRIPDLPLVAGLHPVLNQLKSRCRLGILTSNSHRNVTAFLDAHDLDAFDFIDTASNVWGKGRRLRSVIRARGLQPDQVAYVGDEVRDAEATAVASVRMIAVAWGYSGRELLKAQEPAHLIDTPEQLLEVVAQLQADAGSPSGR